LLNSACVEWVIDPYVNLLSRFPEGAAHGTIRLSLSEPCRALHLTHLSDRENKKRTTQSTSASLFNSLSVKRFFYSDHDGSLVPLATRTRNVGNIMYVLLRRSMTFPLFLAIRHRILFCVNNRVALAPTRCKTRRITTKINRASMERGSERVILWKRCGEYCGYAQVFASLRKSRIRLCR